LAGGLAARFLLLSRRSDDRVEFGIENGAEVDTIFGGGPLLAVIAAKGAVALT
jgi:hypothetical protein